MAKKKWQRKNDTHANLTLVNFDIATKWDLEESDIPDEMKKKITTASCNSDLMQGILSKDDGDK